MIKRVKAIYRAVFPVGLRGKIYWMRRWGGSLLNYALMRRFSSVSAWPHALFIEGTNICNAACSFCAYPQMKRPKVSMSLELFKDVVSQYLALGPGEIDLTPIVGDPFVDKSLFERLDYLRARPDVKHYHFYTNAILMKPEYITRLISHDERFLIFCSFGGFDRQTYHKVMGVDKFDLAVANIRRLIEEKIRSRSSLHVQVNLRVPKGNEKGEFWDYLCRRRDEGVIKLDGTDEYDNWGGKVSEQQLREAGLAPKPMPVHRGPCHSLIIGPMILADGRVNACCCRDVEASLIVGDVKKQPLKDILSGAPIKELLKRHERNDFPEICKLCTAYAPLYPDWMQGRGWKLFKRLIGG